MSVQVWVSDPAEKDRLVQGYKEYLATRDCKHFNMGQAHCPFGANCFYKHALPDGTVVSDNVVSTFEDHTLYRHTMNGNTLIWAFTESKYFISEFSARYTLLLAYREWKYLKF